MAGLVMGALAISTALALRFVSSGFLMFVRASELLAVPFDLPRAAVTETPIPVLQGVRVQSLDFPGVDDDPRLAS
jgi:hypothetical protein